MDINQVAVALQDIFNQPLKDGEKRKIVFWVDKDNEFNEEIEQFALENVKVQQLLINNQFYLKHLLEVEDTASHYLIYTNLELNSEDNWLLDIVLYSKMFYADKISLIINDLQVDTALRNVVKKYERFFQNKERYRKFKALNIEQYNEETIELAIMAVLCNVKLPDFEEILKAILLEGYDDENNKYIEQVRKYFDLEVFWKYVMTQYGYNREHKTLKTLLMHLMVTAFSRSVSEAYLQNLDSFIAKRNKENAVVFLNRWMHHRSDAVVFNQYSEIVEQEIQLTKILQTIPVGEFKQAETFAAIDKAIIIYIANSLLEGLEDFEEHEKLIKLRRSKHFYEKYEYLYDALQYAVKMQAFHKQYQEAISSGTSAEIYNAYQQSYYVMDTYYRKFYVAYDQESNNEIMKKLKNLVEYLYTEWFMGELNVKWSQAVKNEMTDQWSIPGVMNQRDFYSSIVYPHIYKGERAFVIISDAMRYEIGVELTKRLNEDLLGSCELDTMLSGLPSVTKLGMASLLPHKTLSVNEAGSVLLNGKSSSGLENRQTILQNAEPESMAIHFSDVLDMNKAGRREVFKGKKLVYIYHDTIDAMGDKASTEVYTFDAVEKSLNQLYSLVKIIGDDLSGTNVYITADHGFLYQREALNESDKVEKGQINALETKRRYILSKDTKDVDGQIKINLDTIVENTESLNVYVPMGTIRNKIQGAGVNFVHGGASLQEVMVPLLAFKHKRKGQKGVKETSKVDLKLTSTMRKVTNSIFNLDFFQTEKVGERFKARTVKISMIDDQGEVLSNEETVIADRTFDNPADRTFKLQFILRNISYDRSKTYFLSIKDVEVDMEVERIPFSINLGIVSDFDF